MTEPSESTKAVSSWIWSGNLRPLLETVSHEVGYSFDDSDWAAVEAAIPDTDDGHPDGWFSYPLVGASAATVSLAQTVGGDEVMVRVSGEPHLPRPDVIATLLRVFAWYHVT